MEHHTPWVRCYPAPHPAAAMRLLCFPYAGAGPSIFRDWRLPSELGVEVCALHLPGREGRWGEPPQRRVQPLVRAIVEHVLPLLDRPFAFFGHSMGALLAFELTRSLARDGGPSPNHMFLSAYRAPDRAPKREPMSGLPDRDFLARLLELAGTSEAVIRDPDVLLALAPTTRADLELCERHRYGSVTPLNIPLTCFAAEDDSEVDPPDVAAWRRYTGRASRMRTYSGGHLFLHEHRDEILTEIAVDLVTVQTPGGRRPRPQRRRQPLTRSRP